MNGHAFTAPESKANTTIKKPIAATAGDTHCPGCMRDLSAIPLYPCLSCEAETERRSATPEGLESLRDRAAMLKIRNSNGLYNKLLNEYVNALWKAMELAVIKSSALLSGLPFLDRKNDPSLDLSAARQWITGATNLLRGAKPSGNTGRLGQESLLIPRDAKHNADFTMVDWFGTEYQFALGIQSSAIKALWEEWEKTGLGLNQQTIRDAIDTERDSFRMGNAFRNHSAMGTMIHSDGKGQYRLVRPSQTKVKPKNQRKINADTR